jgi:hypothetical protein
MSAKHNNEQIDPELSKARRTLRKDQKDYAQCWGIDKKPFHKNSMLEPTLQAIQELKQFVPTSDPNLVKRDIFKFNRYLEEERILLAEDLVRRVKPGPYENPQHMKLIAYHAASIEMVNRKRSLNRAIDFQTEVVAVYAVFGSTSCQGSNTSKSSTVLARGN